jgi:antitoxin ParD1/3/4
MSVPTRNVVLTEQQAAMIERLVRSGRYQNASEVLRDGLRLVQQREAEDKACLAALRQAVKTGLEDLAAGRYRDFADGESLRSHLAARPRRCWPPMSAPRQKPSVPSPPAQLGRSRGRRGRFWRGPGSASGLGQRTGWMRSDNRGASRQFPPRNAARLVAERRLDEDPLRQGTTVTTTIGLSRARRLRVARCLDDSILRYRATPRIEAGCPGSFSTTPVSTSLPPVRWNTCRFRSM